MTVPDFHNIFFPNQQIDNPKHFAGRKGDIEKALKSLCSPGASIIVFGERGVGKTSFSEMVKLIAKGDTHLLYKHGLQKKYPLDKLKYRVISTDCDAEANTTAKVLQRLITSPLGIKPLINSRIEKTESTIKDKTALEFLKTFTTGFESENKIIKKEITEEDTFEMFTNLITTISKHILTSNEGLLVSIDEFDLVVDSYKMASLIKNLSKNNVKFLISGIAESYDQLLEGHISVARQFSFGRIHIAPLSLNEVMDLFSIIEENSNRHILFDEGFVKEVKERSNGYPYFVQLFGQLALDNYLDISGRNDRVRISTKHLKNGILQLSVFEHEMDKAYLSVIGQNAVKELILKFMAQSISKKIKDDEIYSFCHKHNLMPPVPKNQIASLLAHRDPQFLVRETEESDFVTFKNPLFKIFVNSREPELLRDVNGKFEIP